MVKMFNLSNNIQGEEYNKLLEICFGISTYFSFTKPKNLEIDDLYLNFLDKLSPNYIRSIFTSHWYSYYVLPSNPLEVFIYHADRNAENVVKKFFDNIFQRERNKDGTWGHVRNLPEDLCFFYGKELFLGTVSHEKICSLYPTNKEFAKQLIKLGYWEEERYIPDEQIHIEI